MKYSSTRNEKQVVSGAEAILTGLAPDGGLFVPQSFPKMDFEKMTGQSYQEIALQILSAYLPEYDADKLKENIQKSYATFAEGKVGYVATLPDNIHSLELWHGPTCAFKDYALQLTPKLFVQAREMMQETSQTMILVATSGDTGSAAMAGYQDLPGISMVAFYPTGGTSEIQRLQMVTQEGDNVSACAVYGNFDDAQRGIKRAFSDKELAEKLLQKNIKLSSANSINWGRLLPQIVYYVTTYLHLCEQEIIHYGEPVNYCVPTGNFGDIMAGYYAKQMGLPVGKLICASNQNNVLTDFLQSGLYDTHREFYKTSSPSMDILVSSNLERLLYHETNNNAQQVKVWMDALAQEGKYQVDEATMASIRETFEAGWADEKDVDNEIQKTLRNDSYLVDPHTAVAFSVARKWRESNGEEAKTPMVIVSTASPYKFGEKVLQALGADVPEDTFAVLHTLETYAGTKAPASLLDLQHKKIRFDKAIDPEDIVRVPLEEK